MPDQKPILGYVAYPNAVSWRPQLAQTTNIQPGDILLRAAGVALNSVSSLSGIPQVAQIGQSMLNGRDNYSIYNQYQVAAVGNNKPINIVKYPDFRSRKGYRTNPVGTRLDGLGAALRGSIKAGIYAAATASPLGAYSIFNLDGFGKTGYGWGDHDNPYALKTDFTARSHVATRWKPTIIQLEDAADGTRRQQLTGEWAPTINPLEMATPFRGDKVTVIDFGKRKLAEAYLWKPNRLLDTKKFLGAQLNKLGITQDFIKLLVQYLVDTTNQHFDMFNPNNLLKLLNKNEILLNKFNADYLLKLFPNIKVGGICYNHKLKLYCTIDLYDIDNIIEICDIQEINHTFLTNLLIKLIISEKKIINVYNPIIGILYQLEISNEIKKNILSIISK